eukprot:863076_1
MLAFPTCAVLFVLHVFTSTHAIECDTDLALDLIIILDSSGSVYNRNDGEDPFKYWDNEINFAKMIVDQSLPADSRVGVINFSGCGSSYNKTTCRYEAGQLVRMWGLLDFGTPNDQQALYNRLDEINSTDFLGERTWTDEALGIALEEFKANSTAERERTILLLTDGEPYPITDTYDHDPCYRKWNNDTKQFEVLHQSDNLIALRELNVKILAVGIGLALQFIDQFFKCLVTDFDEHFFQAVDFAALAELLDSVSSSMGCPTSSLTQSPSAPTDNPIPSPTDNPVPSPTQPPTVPTDNPVPSPTNNPTGNPSNHPTGNPSLSPTQPPSLPTDIPVTSPTKSPSETPTGTPTGNPSASPTNNPVTSTDNPARSPTDNPITAPTEPPAPSPTNNLATKNPSDVPTDNPVQSPTNNPTGAPTRLPTDNPIPSPTDNPARPPSSEIPTPAPVDDTFEPTLSPIDPCDALSAVDFDDPCSPDPG